jgi:hypothetical protein
MRLLRPRPDFGHETDNQFPKSATAITLLDYGQLFGGMDMTELGQLNSRWLFCLTSFCVAFAGW